MKIRLLFTALLLFGISAGAVEIIDSKTVYNPGLNDCLASFGGLISKRDVTNLPGAKERITIARRLLTDWITDKNDAGFYLGELDPAAFYWQFIETPNYMGVILVVSSDPITTDFYEELGAGIDLPGQTNHSLDLPWNSKNDVFSFVIDKEKRELLHFENWKFSNGKASVKWMTQSTKRRLTGRF